MIFVTGGTGLVGSHILLSLAKSSRDFKALRRKDSSLAICQNIFKYYNADDLFKKISWVTGDINDIISLEESMTNCTEVIHAAAVVSFYSSDSGILRKVNIEGTENIVNTCLAKDIKKLAYISSIAALGRNSTDEIVNEECYFIPTKLDSNYALSKYYAEQEVWRASQEGLNVVIVNPSVILGPGDWTKGSSQIFQKAYNGLKFYAPGSTGYVDVVDVARATISLLDSSINNERFIVNAANLTYKYFFELLAKEFENPKATIKVTPFLKEIAWRLESIRSFFTQKKPLITKETAISAMTNSSFSNQKIKEKLKFKFIPIEESVQKYCSWYKKDLS